MPVPSPDGESDKTFLVTWLLSLLVGGFGVDRFYLGKIGTGIAKLLTCGGCGVWWLVDLILVLTNSTKDKHGRRLAGYEQNKKVALIVSAVVVALSLVSSALEAPDRIARMNARADSVESQLDELQEGAAAAAEESAQEPVEEPLPEEPAAEEPAAEQGTRENPLPLGTPVTVEDYDGPAWEVTLGAPTYDATEAVRAANQFNEEAPAGLTYVVVPVTVTRLGAAAEAPWIGLNIEYVTASGTTHTSADTMAVAPEPTFNDINELYTGASGAGNVVLAVPTGDAGTGAWKISAMFGDEVFVAGA
ncbi:TM2 domain-containing protein [Cellulomonas fimi]|nr:TM2 domain-containing protein [Cellulomonas fimi]